MIFRDHIVIISLRIRKIDKVEDVFKRSMSYTHTCLNTRVHVRVSINLYWERNCSKILDNNQCVWCNNTLCLLLTLVVTSRAIFPIGSWLTLITFWFCNIAFCQSEIFRKSFDMYKGAPNIDHSANWAWLWSGDKAKPPKEIPSPLATTKNDTSVHGQMTNKELHREYTSKSGLFSTPLYSPGQGDEEPVKT